MYLLLGYLKFIKSIWPTEIYWNLSDLWSYPTPVLTPSSHETSVSLHPWRKGEIVAQTKGQTSFTSFECCTQRNGIFSFLSYINLWTTYLDFLSKLIIYIGTSFESLESYATMFSFRYLCGFKSFLRDLYKDTYS
jgi:hypothetical protein